MSDATTTLAIKGADGLTTYAKFKTQATDILQRVSRTAAQAFIGVLMAQILAGQATSNGDPLFVANHDWLHKTISSALAAVVVAVVSLVHNLLQPKTPQPEPATKP